MADLIVYSNEYQLGPLGPCLSLLPSRAYLFAEALKSLASKIRQENSPLSYPPPPPHHPTSLYTTTPSQPPPPSTTPVNPQQRSTPHPPPIVPSPHSPGINSPQKSLKSIPPMIPMQGPQPQQLPIMPPNPGLMQGVMPAISPMGIPSGTPTMAPVSPFPIFSSVSFFPFSPNNVSYFSNVLLSPFLVAKNYIIQRR